MRSRRWFWVVALLILLGGGWFYFSHVSHPVAAGEQVAGAQDGAAGGGRRGGGGPGGRGAMGGPAPVVAGTVQKKDVPIYLNGIGTAQAYNTVTVHPQINGYLVKVNFQEGQDVKKGAVLGVIDPRPYQAQLDQVVAKKNGDVAQLNNAKVLLQRDTDLLNKGVLDRQTYDTQRFLVDQLDATVRGDQASIDNAQTQLSYTQVAAPLDGRCGLRQTDQGNLVTTGSTLVVITQLKPISVIFTLPQQYVSRVNQAVARGPLKVTALDETQHQALEDGVLAVVNNQIDTSTGTVQLKANFDNDKLQLWPGQFVNTRLLVETKKDGLVVPASVVQRGPNGTFAYVITKDRTAEMRPVEVGPIEGDQALITGGLQEGEQVVVDGQYKLQPGAKVEIVPARSQTAQALAQNDQGAGSDQPQGDAPATSGRHKPSGSPDANASPGGPARNPEIAANGQTPASEQTPSAGQLEAYQGETSRLPAAANVPATADIPAAANVPALSEQNQRANNPQPNPNGAQRHHRH